MRPTSRRAATSSFWRGYAASLRRSWLGRMVPAAIVDATRRMSAQLRPIRSTFTLSPTSGRRRFGYARALEHVERRLELPPATAPAGAAAASRRRADWPGPAVGISNSGSRQQRLSDVAAERVPQQEAGRPRRAVAAQDADRFQQGLGRGRRRAMSSVRSIRGV